MKKKNSEVTALNVMKYCLTFSFNFLLWYMYIIVIYIIVIYIIVKYFIAMHVIMIYFIVLYIIVMYIVLLYFCQYGYFYGSHRFSQKVWDVFVTYIMLFMSVCLLWSADLLYQTESIVPSQLQTARTTYLCMHYHIGEPPYWSFQAVSCDLSR